MSQIWKKSKTFVPTGRIIKYPKKCARRGVPGALPAPPRGVPGHPLAAIDAFGVWTDMTWEAYTGVPRGSREIPKIPKFPENPPKIRISENPENSGKFRIFPPGPILAIFAIFAILPMDPYVGQNGGFRGILPGKGRGWGEPRGDGQGPPRPKAGYPRLAIVDGTNTPTWMTVIAQMPGQLYPRFPWCPPVLRNPKPKNEPGTYADFFSHTPTPPGLCHRSDPEFSSVAHVVPMLAMGDNALDRDKFSEDHRGGTSRTGRGRRRTHTGGHLQLRSLSSSLVYVR